MMLSISVDTVLQAVFREKLEGKGFFSAILDGASQQKPKPPWCLYCKKYRGFLWKKPNSSNVCNFLSAEAYREESPPKNPYPTFVS